MKDSLKQADEVIMKLEPAQGTAKSEKKNFVPTIALDFDGVIHQYKGWNEGKLGKPIPGAREAVNTLMEKGYKVVIHSTRSMQQIRSWLHNYGFPSLDISVVKPMCLVLVDDRALKFDGVWTPGFIDKITGFETYWEATGAEPSNPGI